MVALGVGEESLNFGEGVVVLEEKDVSGLAISVELLDGGVAFLNEERCTSIHCLSGSSLESRLCFLPWLC
jgi:hypothetical protein